jgi:hypothetical protein
VLGRTHFLATDGDKMGKQCGIARAYLVDSDSKITPPDPLHSGFLDIYGQQLPRNV